MKDLFIGIGAILLGALAIIGQIVFYGGAIYIVLHFAVKYW